MRGRTALVSSLAVTVLVVVTVVGVRTWPEPEPAPGPAPRPEAGTRPTTLASYDAQGAVVVRGAFCDRVSPTGIEHALGDVPARSEAWDNGDRVPLPDGSRDRVHEYGCRWTAADGTRAEAWVFAPPVAARQARELRRDRPGEGCRTFRGDDFGTASVAWRCRDGAGSAGGVEERYAGLFGDGWLTCTLTGARVPTAELDVRASEWCVSVLEAARAG